jgi:hypothetical protein
MKCFEDLNKHSNQIMNNSLGAHILFEACWREEKKPFRLRGDFEAEKLFVYGYEFESKSCSSLLYKPLQPNAE